MGATVIYADGGNDERSDTTKLVSASYDYVNAPKDDRLIGRKDGNNGGQ